MKSAGKWGMTVFVVALLCAVVLAQAPKKSAGASKPAGAMADMGKIWTPAEGEWMDIPVFPPGGKMKVINGDPFKGASDMYLKMPAGYVAPWHFHTPIESVYVQAGNMEFEMWKGEKKASPPGSFFLALPKMIHEAKCTGKTDCYLFLHSSGAFDIHLVDANGKEIVTAAKGK